jgi:hypothetical protein
MIFEEKLQILADCGFHLAMPFTPNDLLSSWSRMEFEKPGFDLMLIGLGMSEELKPWRPHCTNLWHFDTECIEGQGSYERIVNRLVEMSQGSLPLNNIKDDVDDENGKTWLSYSYQGNIVQLDLEFDDDWVDSSIFSHFCQLLEINAPLKSFVYYDLGGQDCIIGCISKDNLAKLQSKDIRFVPLT